MTIREVERGQKPKSSQGTGEIAMILLSALLVLVLAIPMAVAGGGNSAETEVLCKRSGSGKLRVRPSDCKRKETQVDLTNLDTPETNATRWSWLGEGGGTYWYVPPANLPAIVWNTADPEKHKTISDQTVWHIQSYQGGYFFGPVVAQLETRPPQCQFLIGSVTPDGRVYIAFNSLPTVPVMAPSLTVGIGQMVKRSGEWTFNMQMSSGSADIQIEHWAFMKQCTPDQDCWSSLPGVDVSVPNFLSLCDAQ